MPRGGPEAVVVVVGALVDENAAHQIFLGVAPVGGIEARRDKDGAAGPAAGPDGPVDGSPDGEDFHRSLGSPAGQVFHGREGGFRIADHGLGHGGSAYGLQDLFVKGKYDVFASENGNFRVFLKGEIVEINFAFAHAALVVFDVQVSQAADDLDFMGVAGHDIHGVFRPAGVGVGAHLRSGLAFGVDVPADGRYAVFAVAGHSAQADGAFQDVRREGFDFDGLGPVGVAQFVGGDGNAFGAAHAGVFFIDEAGAAGGTPEIGIFAAAFKIAVAQSHLVELLDELRAHFSAWADYDRPEFGGVVENDVAGVFLGKLVGRASVQGVSYFRAIRGQGQDHFRAAGEIFVPGYELGRHGRQVGALQGGQVGDGGGVPVVAGGFQKIAVSHFRRGGDALGGEG